MEQRELYAYAMQKRVGSPTILYEILDGHNKIPVSEDKLWLSRYIDEKGLGAILQNMGLHWENQLSHATLIDISYLVNSGLIKEDSLHIVPSKS